jgi:hypothetical protein
LDKFFIKVNKGVRNKYPSSKVKERHQQTVYILKKTSIIALVFTLYLLSLLVFTSSRANAAILNVATSSLSPSVDVQVDHFIEIRNGGLVLINETVTLSTQSNESANLINNFSVGFPFEYGEKEPFGGPEGTEYQTTRERFYPDYCFAFDSQRRLLEVLPDVGLGKIGFYGANVVFPQPVNVSNGQPPYSFTIVFVFSNLLQPNIDSAQIEWNVTFPLYPSIIQDAASCVVKIYLPKETTYKNQTSSVYWNSLLAGAPKDFNVTLSGSRQILSLPQDSLASFSFEPAWLVFYQSGTPSDSFLMLEANEIKREITLDECGRIFCSESYSLTNRGAINITSLKIRVPQETYGISAQDKTGKSLSGSLQKGNATTPTNATISFATPISYDEEAAFTVTYWLPWENYVNQYSWRDHNLAFSFFERQNFDLIIRKLTTTITLPEGAEFILSESPHSKAYVSLQKNVFQEILNFNFYNVTPFDNLDFNLSYGYVIFWASFRPTLWIGTMVAIVCAVAFLWRLPKRPVVPITLVPSKDLRNFVDAYEKKTSILSELILMDEQLAKGKIPRRKYKVRRETFEGRLSLLSRDLAELKEKLRRSGTRYASIIGQIEVTETELEGLETDIKRVEGRYRRGEISKGAYLRLLEEYHRRRERARVTIDGVLLRLKEEIT